MPKLHTVTIVRDYLLRGLLRTATAQLAVLRPFVERRREALASLEVQLTAMPIEPPQAQSLP